jgi:curved DNA-binding protein CbpA
VTEERDPYRILGVANDATDAVVRKAYHAKARRAHPDLVGKTGLVDMQALNWAWALLKDPVRRAEHDKGHGLPGPSDGGTKPAGEAQSATEAAAAAEAQSKRGFGGQPHWTGAAGKPPGRPWGPVVEFGIYAGWSIGVIARRDRGYLIWLQDRVEARAIRPDIERLLTATPGENPTQGVDRRSGGRRR